MGAVDLTEKLIRAPLEKIVSARVLRRAWPCLGAWALPSACPTRLAHSALLPGSCPPRTPQGASSRRHGALIADAKALVEALRQLPPAVASVPGPPGASGVHPPLVHQQEVLSEEQIEAVLHVVRQAQDTKVPKCVPHCVNSGTSHPSRDGDQPRKQRALLLVGD
jgi:hypothetical protein